MPPDRPLTPEEVWHVGAYLSEEMAARGWSAADVALRMGGGALDELTVKAICGTILLPDDDNAILGQVTAAKLAKAFGTSAEFWLDLERTWIDNPNAIRHRYAD